MAVESWDPGSGKLSYDHDIYDSVSDKWLREVDPPFRKRPSSQEAHEVFVESVSVSKDKQTGLISVSVEHESPDIAKQWVELMVSRVSENLRSKDIREAEESIKFLESQREKTSLVSLDEIFAQLIEEQTKTIMLANVSKDYIFDVIDPPVAPERKSKPSRALICVIGTMLGVIIGLLLVLALHYSKSGRSDEEPL